MLPDEPDLVICCAAVSPPIEALTRVLTRTTPLLMGLSEVLRSSIAPSSSAISLKSLGLMMRDSSSEVSVTDSGRHELLAISPSSAVSSEASLTLLLDVAARGRRGFVSKRSARLALPPSPLPSSSSGPSERFGYRSDSCALCDVDPLPDAFEAELASCSLRMSLRLPALPTRPLRADDGVEVLGVEPASVVVEAGTRSTGSGLRIFVFSFGSA